MRRTPRLHAIVLLLPLLWPCTVLAEERWYIFSIGDTPVGWVSEEFNGLRARSTVSARLTRLGKSIDMRFETTTAEGEDGSLQSLAYEALLSRQPLRVEVRVEGDRVRIGTPPQERFVDRGPDTLVGPIGAVRLTAARLRAKGDRVDYAIFSPELQRVARVSRVTVATGERSQCADAPLTRVEETIEGLPTTRTLWVDAAGIMVADSITGPFGPMTTCRATKAAALAASGTLPADLYEKTLARSNVRVADPFAIDRIVVRVRARDASHVLPDFTAHNQRVTTPGVVEISRAARTGSNGAAAVVDREFLEPNALVESGNPDIVRIAASMKTSDPYETALALTAWTAANLTMDAGIVMAPASELVRDRRATCMGYATLLAALARAAGLPSRVVMGYVYYGGIWGGHAWTEMFVEGAWLPFDAAVFAPGVASAMRLSVGASSLADGGGALQGPLAALFGRVDIDTIEYEAGGRVTRVGVEEPPFRVEGHTYVNRGLGLRIDATGWTIERADTTWPSSLVVAFRRAETTIELHHRPRHPERERTPEGDAMHTSVEGGTIWVWIARGPAAAASLSGLLDRVVRVE
jgi:hypothetical protein